MKKKRILSAIVAVAAALCGITAFSGIGVLPDICTTAGAEEAPEGGISVSRAKVRYNESFDVNIDVPANNFRADTVEMRIKFDPDVFEVISWNPVLSGAEKNYDNSTGLVFLAFSSGSSVVDLSNGLHYTATLRAKSGATAGNYTIKLARYIVNSYDNNYRWVPETLTSTVKVTHDLVSLSGTVTSKSSGGTATLTLTDSTGFEIAATANLVYNDKTGFYEGSYLFSEVELGEKYELKTVLSGCRTRTEEIIPSGVKYETANLSLNIPGDVDSDGDITCLDATQILMYLAGGNSLLAGDNYLLSVAHLYDSGTLNIRDATQILRYLAGYTSVLGNIQG